MEKKDKVERIGKGLLYYLDTDEMVKYLKTGETIHLPMLTNQKLEQSLGNAIIELLDPDCKYLLYYEPIAGYWKIKQEM